MTERTDLPKLLDDAAKEPVLLERDGELFPATPEEQDIAHEPDPSLVRQTLAATAGSWADLDVDQVTRDLYDARRTGSRPLDRP